MPRLRIEGFRHLRLVDDEYIAEMQIYEETIRESGRIDAKNKWRGDQPGDWSPEVRQGRRSFSENYTR